MASGRGGIERAGYGLGPRARIGHVASATDPNSVWRDGLQRRWRIAPHGGPHSNQTVGRGDGELSSGPERRRPFPVRFVRSGWPTLRHSALRYRPGRLSPAGQSSSWSSGHGIRTLYGLRGVVERTSFLPTAASSRRPVTSGMSAFGNGIRGVCWACCLAPVGLFADSIGMAFDPGGRRFACSVGHEARLWDIERQRHDRPMESTRRAL